MTQTYKYRYGRVEIGDTVRVNAIGENWRGVVVGKTQRGNGYIIEDCDPKSKFKGSTFIRKVEHLIFIKRANPKP